MKNNTRPFAVFDIDGTLIRWQLYHAAVDGLAKHGLIGPQAYERLRRARMVWKRREHPEAFRAYEKELISVYEESLPGISPQKFDAVAERVASEYKTQVYTYTRGLINELRKKGYVLLAISGSHQELLEHVAKQYGFDDWVGTKYERRGLGFTGKKFVASKDKRTILQEFIKKHSLSTAGSYAVGDSKSDATLLEMVEHPIAFNPDKELFDAATKHGWDVVIERKNVIYKLEAKDGTYILA